MKNGMRAAALALLAVSSLAAWAGTIHGTVTNQTTGKPSSGDSVTLLSLTGAMDELTTAKTDAQGHFSLKTPSDTDPYLIKVEHQKGNYFKNMPPGMSTAEIAVYDVAAKVDGVSTEADVLRIETEAGQLKVTENYFVKNVSSPPRTQASSKTYEIVLPDGATLEGAATVGPSNMPISATPDPISPKGHYAFDFPIRPNERDLGTRFQLSYHINYSGSFTFKPTLMERVDNFVVMLPKTMKLEATGTSFQPVPDDQTGQTLLAKNIPAGQTISFTVSGEGSLPRDAAAQGGGGGGGMGGGAADSADTTQANGPGGKPGGGLGTPIDTPDPLAKYKYWILAGLGLALVVAAAFLLRKPAGSVVIAAPAPNPALPTHAVAHAPIPAAPVSPAKAQMDHIKEELFALESEKISGKISPEEYAEARAALETVLKRAMAREKS